jgi:hypothetical protein
MSCGDGLVETANIGLICSPPDGVRFNQMAMLGGTFFFLLVCGLGLVLYFLPSIIGWNKRNSSAIIALNILLGWTAIGWIVALVWSLTSDQPTQVVVQPTQQLLAPPILCSGCGKYAPPASRFCQSCGVSLP